jgi:hypothetical protein
MSQGRNSPRQSAIHMSPGTMGNTSVADNDEKFDTYKWRDVIIANIEMVDNKVKQ